MIEALRRYENLSKKEDEAIANSASHAVDSSKDDSLVRDAVRQEANLTLEQDNLTTVQDSVEPDIVSLTTPSKTFQWSQPTLEQALSRWYSLGDTSWSYTHAQNTLVVSNDVSYNLFNIQTLFDRIKRFRYWRGGVKVRLQVNSTPFHYGSLLVAIIPHYTPAEEASHPITPDVYELSGQACSGILSANTGKPLELSCPFQCPNEYLDITKLADVRPFCLRATVLNPLKVAGGAINPTLRVSIFAQFTDLQVLGPSEATANSKSVKTTSKKIVPADKEQSNATKQGTLGKVAGVVSDVASKLTAIPVIGSIASAVAPVASMIGGIFDYFGWDKPTNISSQVFTINRPNRGLQHGSGQDPSETLGLKPEQKVSTEAQLFGIEDPCTRSFLKLIQTPVWNSSFTIANAQTTGNVFKQLWVRPYAPNVTVNGPPITLETQRHDYLSYYSQFFTGCRGGYVYYIHFDTSSYTTARIRITFEPSNEGIATITDGGDSFSRIVDINGVTTVAFEVPYCYPSARMPVAYSISGNTPSNGQLLFSLVSPIQTNGSSTDVIFVNVFRAAAEDFRFYQPHIFAKTKTGTMAFANSLSQVFSSNTIGTLGDGPKVFYDRVTEDEEIEAHNDFLHRYHVAQPHVDALCELYPTTGDAFYWMIPFRTYRGATRHHSGSYGNLDGLFLTSQAQEACISAGAYITDDSGVPIEVPYNNNVRHLPMRDPETIFQDAYVRKIRTTTDATKAHLWSAGDDFTLGLRKSPAPVGVAVP